MSLILKGEYNRCKIGRLTLGEKDKPNQKDSIPKTTEEKEINNTEDRTTRWAKDRGNSMRLQEFSFSTFLIFQPTLNIIQPPTPSSWQKTK